MQVLSSLRIGKPSDPVFADGHGQKLSAYCRRVFHRLGIKDTPIRTLRHFAGSRRVQRGIDL
jgi:hypothetical protein